MYLESTDVSAEKSANEISAELVRAGALTISMDYGADGCITGIRWSMAIKTKLVEFAIPARTDAIEKYLTSKAPTQMQRNKAKGKARRIAWRQLYRWVQIQNALVQTGMAEPHQVYMPYAINVQGSTMFEVWQSQLALPAGEAK